MIWPTNDEQIIENFVLVNEGGYVDNPDDPGGPTNMGITQVTLSQWLGRPASVEDVKNLTSAIATAIYQKMYIQDQHFDLVNDLHVRTQLVDMCVLLGPDFTVTALQKIAGVPIDGVLGPVTAAATNRMAARSVVNQLSVARILFHADRCASDPSQVVFLQGWDKRACQLII